MSDKPAFPPPDTNWEDATSRPPEISGLTRRELFAAMAMQGLCAVYSNPDMLKVIGHLGQKDGDTTSEQTLARYAVNHADALIAELDKES